MDKSDIIASLAILVAIASAVWTWVTDRKLKKQQKILNQQQLQINETLLAKNKEEDEAKKKANPIANLEGRLLDRAIRFTNKGPADARNLRFEDPANKITISPTETTFPDCLSQGDSFRVCIFHTDIPPNSKHTITLIWDDDFAKDNKKEQILQF